MITRVGWVLLTAFLPASLVAAEIVPPNAELPKPQFSPTPPPNAPLPKPEFMGTPLDARAPVPDRPRNTLRVSPALPSGMTNVALHKPVTASDAKPSVGMLRQITAGQQASNTGYVELAPGKQYFQIDLQDTYRIQSIVVWHYLRRPRVYRDVVVQLCDKPGFTSNVQTVFNNDNDNSLGFGIGADQQYIETREGLTIDAKAAPARYVRLYSNGNTDNDRNHLTAVEVYGAK